MAQNMDPRGRPHRSRNPLWSIRLEYFKSNGRILSYWISKMTITRLDKYYVHGHPEVERPLLDKETRPIGEEDTQHPRAGLFLSSPSEGPSVFTGSDIKARGCM